MADLKAQLAIAADATGVEAGVSKAKKSLASLGATAQTEGAKAAKGIEGIGAGGEQAAAKVDRSTRSLINSIQRTTATLEAGGRSSAKYFETLASQRGVDTGALKPYLDQLEAVRQKQAEATLALVGGGNQLNKYGQTAKQTAAAMRQVPAQLTDIIVGLQGGQAPLTVLLQQGGQLRDVFGGIVPAARALGGAVLGLVNPFTVVAGAVAALGFAYFQGSKEADAYAKALILTGNAAGTSVDQLAEMAKRLGAVNGSQSQAAAALAEFAGSSVIASNNFERFAGIALKVEKATGQSVAETRKQFEELAKSPVEASAKLNQSTNFLTASLYQQIKALEEQGRVAEAGALAQNALASTLENRLGKVQERLGSLERGWNAVAGAAKWAWDKMLNVGRQDTIGDQIAASEAEIRRLQGQISNNIIGGGGAARSSAARRAQADLLVEQERLNALREQRRLLGSVADQQREAAAQVKARIDFDKAGEQFLDNRAKMEKAIAEARNQGLAAGASQEEIEKRIAAIREKYRDKKTGLIDRAELNLDLQAIRSAAEQLVGTYANSERIIESLRSSGLINDREYYESKRAFINLESEAKESALRQEIARFQQEKLTGKDKIDNERKIAEAASKLAATREEAAAKLEVLNIQEAASVRRLEQDYTSARQAAQEYFDAIQRQQNRDIAGIGQGDRARQIAGGLNQIEDRYSAQRLELENRRSQAAALAGERGLTEAQKTEFDRRLALINEFQGKSIQSYLESVERRKAAEADWSNGASEAAQNYLDRVQNVAAQVADAFTNAFKSIEDVFVNFAKTGKLEFKSLADSIISDIARIYARKLVAGLVGNFFSATSGGVGGSSGGLFSSFFSGIFGKKADGGPVTAGQTYLVGERGMELFTPNTSGTITSNEELAGAMASRSGPSVVVHQNFTVGDVATISMVRQAVAGSEARIASSLNRSMKYGGAPV